MSTWHYLTNVTLDEPSGHGLRVLELARAIARFADVTIFAPLGTRDLPVALPGNVGLVDVRRASGSLPFQLALMRALQKEPLPDVCLAYPAVDTALAVWQMHARGLPTLVEVRGVSGLKDEAVGETEEIPARGAARPARGSLREGLVYRHLASGIVPLTEQLRDYLVKSYNLPRRKMVVAPNGADAQTTPPLGPAAARAKLGLDRPGPVIGYAGSIEPWQGVETLLRGFAQALQMRSDLTLLILGSGSQAERFSAVTRLQGLERQVLWLGWHPPERAREYLQACDVLVAPLIMTERVRIYGAEPLKMGTYLAAGRAILATAVPGLEYVQDEGVGRLCTPGDPLDLSRKLLDLAADAGARDAMGSRALRLAETSHSWRSIAWKVVTFGQDQIDGFTRARRQAGKPQRGG